MGSFYLSFHNGMCRLSHGDSKDAAIADSLQAASNTGMTCNLLDENYKVLGTTAQRNGHFTFEARQEKPK